MTCVRIVQLSAEAIRALADGDLAAAQGLAPVTLSPWLISEHPRSVWQRRAAQVVQTPKDLAWVTGVLFDDVVGQSVGAGGFHAAPDQHGMVEAGSTRSSNAAATPAPRSSRSSPAHRRNRPCGSSG